MSENVEKRVQKRPRVHEMLSSSWEELDTEPGSSNNAQEWFKKAQLAEQIARMERDIAEQEICLLELKKTAGLITPKEYKKGMKMARKRIASALDGSWMRKNTEEFYDALLSDRPNADRTDVGVWCHISGRYLLWSSAKAVHIVPFYMDDQLVLKHLFGERAGEIGSPTNCLLLEDQLEGWFDKYQFVIVPVDPSEVPITRWKVELISPDIKNAIVFSLLDKGKHKDQPKAKDTLDQRELVFLNHNRPASRFLFFRFMLALIRIRQLKRTGWEDVWARYRTNKPFATPGRYTRTGMLLAMAAHNEITAPEEIEGFLRLVEAEKVPRTITLPEAEILRVKEEVAKAIESFETARDNHEDRENEDTDTEDDELEYSTMDDGYEDDDDQDDDSG